ncbi:MAG: hypothetical protein WC882_04860 [Candidatus Gracilibacteria bacterium]
MGGTEGRHDGENEDGQVVLMPEVGTPAPARIICGPCDFSREEWDSLIPAEQGIVGMICPSLLKGKQLGVLRMSGNKLRFLEEVRYAFFTALQSKKEILKMYAEGIREALIAAIECIADEDLSSEEIELFRKCQKIEADEEVGIVVEQLRRKIREFVTGIRNQVFVGNQCFASDLVSYPGLRGELVYIRKLNIIPCIDEDEGDILPVSWERLKQMGYVRVDEDGNVLVTKKGQQVYLPEMDEGRFILNVWFDKLTTT